MKDIKEMTYLEMKKLKNDQMDRLAESHVLSENKGMNLQYKMKAKGSKLDTQKSRNQTDLVNDIEANHQVAHGII